MCPTHYRGGIHGSHEIYEGKHGSCYAAVVANRKQGADRRSVVELREQFVSELRQGQSIPAALAVVGRSRAWYNTQRAEDREWAGLVDRVRTSVTSAGSQQLSVPDFPEFCEQYLGFRLWDHQLAMFDVLEGRTPRWLPDGLTYEPASYNVGNRVLINIPPFHAKTMTVSISYVLWRVLRNPSMSVLLISKTQEFAKKILYAIKQRLTHPQFAELQLAFGPVDGFKAAADMWTANRVYLGGEGVDQTEKDPTIEALGIGGHVYGSRAQLILVDDAIVLSNANAWEGQQDWLRQEVASRLGPDDQLVIVGTRVAPVDLYHELRNPDHYHDGNVPWTYLGMPAVLEYRDRVEDWVTLWPRSDQPFVDSGEAPGADGMFDRWSGPRLAKIRNELGPKRWSMVYQQQDVQDESTFDPWCVKGSIDGLRGSGVLVPGVTGHPEPGAQVFTIVGIDPAVVGNTAACVYAFDRRSARRWIVDMRVITGPSPRQIRELIESLVEKYHPQEVVVEANAFQLYLVQDENINRFLASRGIPMKPHYTYRNKLDPLYGVASMAPLFGTTTRDQHRVVHQKDNLVSLPNQSTPGIKKLVDELVAWNPTTPTRHLQQDAVMAMWVAETRARELINVTSRQSFALKNSFLSERDKARRFTVDLSDAAMVAGRDPRSVYL